MKTNPILALATILTAALASVATAKQEPAPPFEPTLPWLTDLEEALAESKKTGKPILAEFR